jgi:hypothetical protein
MSSRNTRFGEQTAEMRQGGDSAQHCVESLL